MAKGSIKLSELLASQKNIKNLETGPGVRKPGTAPEALPEEPQRLSMEEFKKLTTQKLEQVDKVLNPTKATTTESEKQKVSPNEKVTVKADNRIFEDFVKQTQRREDLLKDATKEQRAIFKELEKTIDKLRISNDKDTDALKKALNELTKKLGATKDTAAKRQIVQSLPKEYRPPTYVKSRTPAEGTLFEGSRTVGSVPNESDIDTGEGKRNLSDLLENALLLGGANKLLRNMGNRGGTPGTGTAESRSKAVKNKAGRKPGTVYEESPGKFKKVLENGSEVYTKERPPSLLKRTGQTLSKAGNVAGKALPFVTGGIQAYDEYEKNRDATRAAAVAGGSVVGGELGAVIGSVAGPLGTLAGGYLGSIAGGKVGEVADSLISDKERKKMNDFAEKYILNPTRSAIKATEKGYEKVKELTVEGVDKLKQVANPTIIVPPSNNAAPPPAPQNIHLGAGNTRPTESAIDRYTWRNYFG